MQGVRIQSMVGELDLAYHDEEFACCITKVRGGQRMTFIPVQCMQLTESQHTPRADAPTGKRQRNPVGGRAVLGEKLRFWSSVFKAESRFLHFYPV